MTRSTSAARRKSDETRALVRDGVEGETDGERRHAPRGEYAVTRSDCGVGLCGGASENSFTLSYDAFLQHITEGRISLLTGKA